MCRLRLGLIVATMVSFGLPCSTNLARAGDIRVVPGFGVDTLRSPNREIYELWRTYLTSRPDSLRPSVCWSAAEQARWPDFDLLRTYVYQGFTRFTVVHLGPAVGLDSTYVIRTLVSGVDDSTHDVSPLALYRVYVVRERGQWSLANAYPFETRGWARVSMGRVRYVVQPGRAFDPMRARRAGVFVDSLAAAYRLTVPDSIVYVLANDQADMFRAVGLEFFPTGGPPEGARANAGDRMVLVGSRQIGEDYFHELAHLVFKPMMGAHTARQVNEGLATWCGGSAGLDYAGLVPGLGRYLGAHPELTLRAVMTNPPLREGTLDVEYDGFAVLCKMIYDKRGADGIRQFVNSGITPDEVLTTAARLLGIAVDQLDRTWRVEVLAAERAVSR